MWIMQVASLSEKYNQMQREPLPASVHAELQQRSSFICAVGRGRELLFVLGWLPPALISAKNYMWLSMADEVTLTLGELRTLRKLFTEYMRNQAEDYLAEVDPSNRAHVKFVEFMGFKYQTTAFDGRAVYRWSV